MYRNITYILSLFSLLFAIRCYPTFYNRGDPETAMGLLYSVDFSEVLGNVPEIVISNQQTSITEGETVDLRVRLSKASIGNKNIIVSSDNPAITINGSDSTTLTFSPDNSTEDQVITLKAENDENAFSEEVTIKYTSNWTSEIVSQVTNQDIDTQAILVSSDIGSLEIDRGKSFTFYVSLSKMPINDIKVNIYSSLPGLINFSSQTLTFSSESYNIKQNIQVNVLNKLDHLSKFVDIRFELSGIVTTQIVTVKPNLEFKDISAEQGVSTGYKPTLKIDYLNEKILVTTFNINNGLKPSLFRCNLDGTNCIHADISAGQGIGSGYNPTMAIDSVNNKLLLVTTNYSNLEKPGLFRCSLDGTGCIHTDISAGQGDSSGEFPAIIIDRINNKLLVVTQNEFNSEKSGLFRCSLDGTGCIHTDISAGQGMGSGKIPSITLDTINNKLLVVTTNELNSDKPSLFRCDLDGSNCTHTDISADAGPGSGYESVVVVDEFNEKLLVVTRNNNLNNMISLFRCNLDGTGCTHSSISADQGDDSGYNPSVIIDENNQKLLVAVQNKSDLNKPGLFRCDLDGSNCTYADISAGQTYDSGKAPTISIDKINNKILVVTRSISQPGLFILPLNYQE